MLLLYGMESGKGMRMLSPDDCRKMIVMSVRWSETAWLNMAGQLHEEIAGMAKADAERKAGQ